AKDFTDNITLTQTAVVTFTAGAVSAAASTVVANPTSVGADGTTSTITVTLKDSNGNPVSGKTVTLTASAGNSVVTTVSGVTDSNGHATFTVSDHTIETITYTATDTTDNIAITQTASVSFTLVQTVSAANSTVVASPTSVVADGTSISTITVTLLDTT